MLKKYQPLIYIWKIGLNAIRGKKFIRMETENWHMSTGNTDEFGVMKIFSDDTTNPQFMKFEIGKWKEDKSGDREHIDLLRYTSTKDGKPKSPKNSVVSTRWTKSGTEFVDVEVTGYFFLPEIESDKEKEPDVKFQRCGKGSSLTIKLRGGKHPNEDNNPNSARCYNFDFQYKGGDCHNFQKEYPHPKYYKMDVGTRFNLKDNMAKWVGYKAVALNQGDTVRCLAFVDYGSEGISKEVGPDLKLQNWKLYYDVTDDGKLDEKVPIDHRDEYKNKKEVKEPFKTHWGEKAVQFRMDRILVPEAKFLSARRISAALVDDIVKAHISNPVT